MPFSFLPSVIVTSVTQIDPAFLKSRGIELLMLDFDNTLVPYTTSQPTADMELWIKCMTRVGVRMCVVSNSHKDRVKVFCRKYGLPCITHAKKPFSKGIRECLEQFAMESAQCAIAGDQIFTDTLGGNCAGLQTILVKPIHNHNFWLKARHVLEKPFIFAARKRRVSL